MVIPWQKLSEEALNHILESYILREGTDYGVQELSLEQKKQRLFLQLQQGKVVIVWSELFETIDIKTHPEVFGH